MKVIGSYYHLESLEYLKLLKFAYFHEISNHFIFKVCTNVLLKKSWTINIIAEVHYVKCVLYTFSYVYHSVVQNESYCDHADKKWTDKSRVKLQGN